MLTLNKSEVTTVERYEIEHDVYKGFYVLVTEFRDEEDGLLRWSAALGHEAYGINYHMFAYIEDYCKDKAEFLDAVQRNLLYNNYIEDYIREYIWGEDE